VADKFGRFLHDRRQICVGRFYWQMKLANFIVRLTSALPCFVMPWFPFLIKLGIDVFRSQTQRTQADLCKVLQNSSEQLRLVANVRYDNKSYTTTESQITPQLPDSFRNAEIYLLDYPVSELLISAYRTRTQLIDCWQKHVHDKSPAVARVSRPYSWYTFATCVHNCPSMMFRTCCCLRPKCKRSYLLIYITSDRRTS